MTFSNTWRVYNVEVLLESDPGMQDVGLHEALVESLAKELRLHTEQKEELHALINKQNLDTEVEEDICQGYKLKVVRKSFDGRWKRTGQPKFMYTLDVTFPMDVVKRLRLTPSSGRLDAIHSDKNTVSSFTAPDFEQKDRKKVVVVGAGPAGLFAAIELIKSGYKPVIVERGQPVGQRGLDIGALFHRKVLNPDSNLCFGEGGAGTWSDGKLTTRIGKNSEDVRQILETLVDHGAPESILVAGKPHLGTDKLVRILKSLRERLIETGAEFIFGYTVTDVLIEDRAVRGVTMTPSVPSMRRRKPGMTEPEKGRKEKEEEEKLGENTVIEADRVVLAVGHSARQLYDQLLQHGVSIETKPIAVGFRVEHPQELINRIQYGDFGEKCEHGKGPIPVADYRLAVQVEVGEKDGIVDERACYSFCMCPGGQIVPTSVHPRELCINGMSFSQRQSKWANSALVVTVRPEDMFTPLDSTESDAARWDEEDPLRGVFWQEYHERKAAIMGGGDLVAPVQRVTDFLTGTLSTPDKDTGKFSSSYRMGVKSAPLHELYPSFVTEAVRKSLVEFDKLMPGFLSHDGLLHGIETRTSAPVQITRDRKTMECSSLSGLYPAGEGAGYAGGIVSAAVDGIRVGRAIKGEFSESTKASFLDTY